MNESVPLEMVAVVGLLLFTLLGDTQKHRFRFDEFVMAAIVALCRAAPSQTIAEYFLFFAPFTSLTNLNVENVLSVRNAPNQI